MVIYLEANTSPQKIALTCTELATIPNPAYLFAFTHEATKQRVEIFLPDLSRTPDRFNLFEVSPILFPAAGWYLFEVFEAESEAAEIRGNIVEWGRLFVDDGGVSNTSFNEQLNIKEYVG